MVVWHLFRMPTLLVAVAGSHLEELFALRPRLASVDDDVVWVTTDTPQSRSLLATAQRLFAPTARPRDAAATLATSRFARHVLALGDWNDIVSTGALVGVPFLVLGRARGARCHFIESPARVTSPSLSGRILERVPGVHCYSPYPRWTRPPWVYRGSVLDGLSPAPAVTSRLGRVVVTVGTNGYGFGRLVRRLTEIVPSRRPRGRRRGPPPPSPPRAPARGRRPVLPREGARPGWNPSARARRIRREGLAALRAGRAPLLVPRRAAHGEHVDDHQVGIADELARRELATACEVEDLDLGRLWRAAARRVALRASPPPFVLEGASAAPAPSLEVVRATA